MIELDIPKNVTWIKGFRLLNSEIGNDRVGYPKECHMD